MLLRLLLCCLLCAQLFSSQVADDQIFIQRLQEHQLARLSMQLWQRLDKQTEHMAPSERYLHHVLGLRFKMEELRQAANPVERTRLWMECETALKRIHTQGRAESRARVESALLRFELAEFCFLHEMESKSHASKKVSEELEELIDKVEQGFHDVAEQDRKHLLNRLRYAVAWSSYFYTQTAQAVTEEEVTNAREYLEDFLDYPLHSPVFVRACLAIVKLDVMLKQREEALFLLDDVEQHAHAMPLDSAIRIWRAHLEIVQYAEEWAYVCKQLGDYLDQQTEEDKRLDELRLTLIKRLVMLNEKVVNEAFVKMARHHIDALFESDSPLAEQCLPYVIAMARIDQSDVDYQHLQKAEDLFKESQYEKAAKNYALALHTDLGRENIHVRHLLTIKWCLSLHRSGSSAQALSVLSKTMRQLKQDRYRNFTLRLILQIIEQTPSDTLNDTKAVYEMFVSLPQSKIGASAHASVLKHILYLCRQEQFQEASTLMGIISRSEVLGVDVHVIEAYVKLMNVGLNVEGQVAFMHTLKLMADNMQGDTLRAMALQVLAWQGLEGKALAEQQTLAAHLRQAKLLDADDLRRVEFLLADAFQRRNTLQFQRELLEGLYRTGVRNDWELDAILSIASYFDARCRQRLTNDDAYYAGTAYAAALQYLETSRGQEHFTVQLAYVDLLIKTGAATKARALLKQLNPQQRQSWPVQRALVQCLEAERRFQDAAKSWRALLAQLKVGETPWLRCKWHIAFCHVQSGDMEHARKLLDYIMLMHPQMHADLKADYQDLRKMCQ